jgi:hypothetical protein
MTPLFSRLKDVVPTRTLFLRAADLIEKNGKIERTYCDQPLHYADESCRFCIMGALIFGALGSAGGSALSFGLERKLADPFKFDNGVKDVLNFSDDHNQEEVVAKLREVAATLSD